MVKNAWVGSSVHRYESLKKLIEANIADGRAVTVAVEQQIG